MVRSPASVLGLAVLVVLAGCNGGVTDAAVTQTVTPAPVPSPTPATPPGVSGGGVAADGLADAHQSVLSTTNYTVAIDEQIVDANRTLRETSRRRYVAEGASEYRTVRHQIVIDYPAAALASDIGYWYNGSMTLFRFAGDGPTRYRQSTAPGSGPLIDPTSHGRLASTIDAFRLRVVNRTGRTTRLESTRLAGPAEIPTPTGLSQPRNGSLLLVVDSNGVIREAELTYEATLQPRNETVRVSRAIRFVSIGETTVTRPPWAGEAVRYSRATTG